MASPVSSSAALRIARALLRFLVVINLAAGIPLTLMFIVSPDHQWTRSAFEIPASSPDADRLFLGLRAIGVLGLVSIPLYHVILSRTLAIVGTVRAGDPFIAVNASRLHAVARALLVLQLLDIPAWVIVKEAGFDCHQLNTGGASSSIAAWLIVLLAFVLAHVFAEGTRMRDDLEGTV